MDNVIDGRDITRQTTKSGVSYSVKKWLNKAESRELAKFLAKHSVIEDGKVRIEIKDLDAMIDFHDIIVRLYAFDINGNRDIMAAYDSLREEDAEEIQSASMDVYNGAEKKTKDTPTNTGDTSTPEPAN